MEQSIDCKEICLCSVFWQATIVVYQNLVRIDVDVNRIARAVVFDAAKFPRKDRRCLTNLELNCH